MADGIKKINEWILKDGRVIGITKDISADKFEPGTFFINPHEGILKYNNVSSGGAKSWQKFLPSKMFEPNSISRELLKNSIINSDKIEDNSINANKIENNSITNIKIANNSISTEKIINESITTEKIKDYSITEFKIQSEAVTSDKIRDMAINSDKIAFGAVLNNHIADGTITQAKFANKSISNEKIVNGTIINQLIANDAIEERNIKSYSIKSKHISPDQIMTDHIRNKQINGSKILENSIKNEHIVNASVSTDKLMDLSITTSKIKDYAITNSKISDESIDWSKLEQSVKNKINDAIRVDSSTGIATIGGHLKVIGNITSTGTITGSKVFNPVFADVAEAYIPTREFNVGEAVCLSEDGELLIEELNEENAHLFLGFISDQYAACYGATPEEILNGTKVAVALTGRIPVLVDDSSLFKIGEFIRIDNGKITSIPMRKGEYKKSCISIGRVIDILKNDTILVQV